MAKLSKDILDDVEAKIAIEAIEDAMELQAFIKGERREALLDVAVFRLNVLKSAIEKQGEQTGPFTKETHEFKGSGVEGTKGLPDKPKPYLTIEDVLAAQRKAGRKI